MSHEELFDASYRRVLERKIDGKDFFEAFYDKFLSISASIREKFTHTDMPAQRKMLKKSFYHMLVFYGSNQAEDYLVKIAEKHDKHHLDIPPAMYDAWLEALIDTLNRYDECVDDEIELAWRLVLAPGITYMKFKYDHFGEHPTQN